METTRAPRSNRRWLRRAQWAYLGFAALALLAVRYGGDRWGWATLLSYGPRWVVLLPAAPVLAWALWRRRWPWPTLAGLALTLGPTMGLHVPLGPAPAAAPAARTLRVLSLNAYNALADLNAVSALVRDNDVSIAFLQEWRGAPATATWGPGWHSVDNWGVSLASRFPILETDTFEGRDHGGGEGRIVAVRLLLPGDSDGAPGRPTWCFAVHMETPRRGFEPVLRGEEGAMADLGTNIDRRRRVTRLAAQWVRDKIGPDGDAVIVGDFNTVGDGTIWRESWSAWTDAFAAVGLGYGWTKHEELWAARIDHVLTGGAWRPRRCRVGPDVGSDHLPVLAELVRP